MLHVDPYRLDSTVARSGLGVLIDHRTHQGSGPLLQGMYLGPETFPAERESSLIHVQPTYVGHSRATPGSRFRSCPLTQLEGVEVREQVREEVFDRGSDVAQHRSLRRRVYWATAADLATLIAMANTDEVVRLRLLRAIRDLGA